MSFTVRALSSPADNMKFIKSQWRFYEGDPNWAPPILADRKKLLNTRKNPFYKHASIQLFLAEENGEAIGRIAAIVNTSHNETHNDAVGFFGFFECVDRQDVANALFTAAESWLRERGMTDIRGPVNPSMNDECALLVDGFDKPPVVLMTYNPQYYAALIEGAGLKKVKDLYAYFLKHEAYRSEKLTRLVNVVRERNKVTIRNVNFKNKQQFKLDIATLKSIYNEAWQPNWGFVKLNEEEFDALANDLKQIAIPDLTFIVEVHGVPAGFMLALPDVNQALIFNKSGSLLGAAWSLLTKRKYMNQTRIVVLGVLPQYQRSGIDAVMYYEASERSLKHNLHAGGEASWILEDNEPMNLALTKTMNGELYKTYRLYQKSLT